MLQTISATRHAIVGAAVVATAALGAFSVVGAGDQARFRAEHFDAKQVTVSPVGDANPDGVRIREVVDIDFGVNERRGYQRIIPNDFGVPEEIEVSSPDANDELAVVPVGGDTRIRVGNPGITFTGQHRYILEYTLPDAQLENGGLALDIIAPGEAFQTDRFEVEVVGFELSDPVCDVGRSGDFGNCDLDPVADGRYATVLEPLDAGDGISVFGQIDSIIDADLPDVPALPERNPTGPQLIGLLQLGVGGLLAAGIFLWFRRAGSNVVFGGGGAADAAFGQPASPLPVPVEGDPIADVPTHRVPDSRLAELATIEFTPPRGVEPWQGNVLLRETVDDDSVSAWFSEMIARDAIQVTGTGKELVLRPGQSTARLSAVDRAHLGQLFSKAPAVTLGKYDKDFTKVWTTIKSEQKRLVNHAGWWERPLGGSFGAGNARSLIPWIVGAGFIFATSGIAAAFAALFNIFNGWIGAIALTVIVTAVVATLVYWKMLASRTATGSALTLRTESFRRFLDASEGRHVEWAWEHNLIREYSAWAVALGAATAWSEAIESSNIAHPEQFTAPLLVYTYGSMFRSARTAPSSSGSGGRGGGGGFSGGGVGGGGGGGSSGSW